MILYSYFFVFKQKTAYEMRISDWSSDVCSSDLVTMLGLSRWAGKGGSDRTVQRFFSTVIPWATLFWVFFRQHVYRPEEVYLLVEIGRASCRDRVCQYV